MVQRNVSLFIRVVAPVVLVLSLILFFISSVPVSARSVKAQALHPALVGPKSTYLAIGDSLAFGLQPNGDNNHGYADDFFNNDLKARGVQTYVNMGCSGETSTTMLNGGCPVPFLRKFSYSGAQLNAAVAYLNSHPGQVSPVTLDIGANDVDQDINTSNCTVNQSKATADLQTLDNNLTHTILPRLVAAMTVNGKMTGDLLVMNYYNPFENECPNSMPFAEMLNEHIAADISGSATLVDVFSAFGGTVVPNPNLCNYTWMCSNFPQSLAIHAKSLGYSVIANAFEQTAGY